MLLKKRLNSIQPIAH